MQTASLRDHGHRLNAVVATGGPDDSSDRHHSTAVPVDDGDDDEAETPPSSSTTTTGETTTTILDAGTVESRGTGVADDGDDVNSQIESFLTLRPTPASELRALLTSLIFVTRIPAPAWVDLHPGHLMRGMAYLPLLGAALGALESSALDFAIQTLSVTPAASAGLAAALGMCLTGCLHEDGLADAADGIGGGWTRAQILKIMTDSRVGTFGCAALILHTLVKVEVLGGLGGSHWEVAHSEGAGPALLVAQAMSRLTAPYLLRTRDYVDDEDGPKTAFYSFLVRARHLVSWQRVLFAALTSLSVAAVLYGPATALALATIVLAVAECAGRYGTRVLGGVMGDFLGATICVAELAVLMGLASRGAVVRLAADAMGAAMSPLETCHADTASSGGEETGGGSGGTFWQVASSILEWAWHDERIRPLLRFFALAGCSVAWCRFVGRTGVLVVKEDSPAGDGGGSGGTPNGEGRRRPQRKDTPERTRVERVCTSPTSTFSQRYDAARVYLDSLAKPVGSLGALEDWSARLAALQRTSRPTLDGDGAVGCLIFAADHGVAGDVDDGGEKCSMYPQSVTRAVLAGLERGVAGASVLAECNDVRLRVVDVGVVGGNWPIGDGEGGGGAVVVTSKYKLRGGTKNFCVEPAMTEEGVEGCIRAGREALSAFVEEKGAKPWKMVALGEVGIGNTTSASALVAVLTSAPDVAAVCGGGATTARTADDTVVARKADIVRRGLQIHRKDLAEAGAEGALRCLGGAEIAAMVGAIWEASERDVPVLIDGFIATAAALVAVGVSPRACRVLFLATRSAERGHVAAVDAIRDVAGGGAGDDGVDVGPPPASPALDMGLRMGEGTGAILAVPIARSAAAVLSNLATIQEITEEPQLGAS